MNAADLVKTWMEGRATVDKTGVVALRPPADTDLAHKFRRAYTWISETAILSPYGDIESGTPTRLSKDGAVVDLFDAPTWASFLLLPLLTLATGRRLVFLGAPGRGKTSVATLMGLLAGGSLTEVRQAIQHGHPQLTLHDLLGAPLPSRLMHAETAAEVKVDWRRWIFRRVKIVDEYNRIPTKTQSALLSLMADGYAEMYEQVVHAGPSAWFLTANDDLGGGTFPVIEALRDRIDVVVRCNPFHTQHLQVLADRIASTTQPEALVPEDIVFSAEELEQVAGEIREVDVPAQVLGLVGFLLGQLDFCRRASEKVAFMNKDTLHLAGRRVGQVCTEDCPLDKQVHLCSQTENGVSPRSFQATLHYAKAFAWFSGRGVVAPADIKQILPWVLFDRLRQNPQSPFFHKAEHKIYLTDRVSWIHQLFDRATQMQASYQTVRTKVDAVFKGVDLANLDSQGLIRLADTVRRATEQLLHKNELSGPVHEDIIRLVDLHARIQRRLAVVGHHG